MRKEERERDCNNRLWLHYGVGNMDMSKIGAIIVKGSSGYPCMHINISMTQQIPVTTPYHMDYIKSPTFGRYLAEITDINQAN